MKNSTLYIVLAICLTLSVNVASEENTTAATYIGAQECVTCHKDRNHTFLGSRHGKVFVNNPMNTLQAKQCEACHGPGSKHIEVVGDLDYKGPFYIRNFKTGEVSERNSICLNCHNSEQRIHWQSSTHAAENLACTSCHNLHTSGKTVTQEVCGTCHRRERAKLQRTEHMPIREGLMTCMDCHNPHGGIGPSQLKVATITDTCYQCHAEKRGPNLWEHPPVRENCANCHDPHGSNHRALLKRKPPHLCQMCHQVIFHPSDLYDGNDLVATGNPARQLVNKGCVNCHSRIHGSNHPSGIMFQR